MKVLLNCCPRPYAPLFKGDKSEKAEAPKTPVTKPIEQAKDTVEISKPKTKEEAKTDAKVETKPEVKSEVKPEAKAEVKTEGKTVEVKPAIENKKETPAVKCEGDACKK